VVDGVIFLQTEEIVSAMAPSCSWRFEKKNRQRVIL